MKKEEKGKKHGSSAIFGAFVGLVGLLIISIIVLTSMKVFYVVKKVPDTIIPISKIEGSDASGSWSVNKNICIFDIQIDENNGQSSSVVSGSGDKLLFPGAKGEYVFSLYNDGDARLTYTTSVSLSISQKLDSFEKFPIEIKLFLQDQSWLVGDFANWAHITDLKDISVVGELPANESQEFVLQWMWPYESGSDDYDTMLGNLAEGKTLQVTLDIETIAECSSEAVENPNYKPLLYSIIPSVGILILAGAIIGFVIHERKNRKKIKTTAKKLRVVF